MEFKQAMRVWARMCSHYGSVCDGCELYELPGEMCHRSLQRCPDEAEAILARWAAEHPEKTIADDFFEKHPKAPRDESGAPTACAHDCGYVDACAETAAMTDCGKCWQRPLEVVEI